MREALKAARQARREIVVYPDAPHGFNADYRPSYRKEDAEDGWNRMLAWFKLWGVDLQCGGSLASAGTRPIEVELVVGPHADHVGHAVGQREERGDRADVPSVLFRESVGAQRLEVGVHRPRCSRSRPSLRTRALPSGAA